jgi:mRNA interferase RelE/StbE
MPYAVRLKPRAERDLDRLPIQVARRIWQRLLALETNPRPPGCTKLVGEEDAYRIRVGDYRVVYLIDDKGQLVEIVRVAHRREVYR